jgi:hypothetical protein
MSNTSTGLGVGQSGLATLEKKLTGQVPDDADIPRTVRSGVRFMLAGAALTLLAGIFYVIVFATDEAAVTGSNKLSTGQVTSNIASFIVSYVILIAIWVVMARMNRAGRSWARILASVFCLISTYEAYALVNSLTGIKTVTVAGIVYVVLDLAIWAVGVLSIAMIWRSESSAYYKARSAVAG